MAERSGMGISPPRAPSIGADCSESDRGDAVHPCARAARGACSPRAARSSWTPGSTPVARRTTSSSCASLARRTASVGRSTPSSPRRVRSASATRSSRISNSARPSTSSTRSPAPIPTHRIARARRQRSRTHALFAKTLFIDPTEDELEDFSRRRSSCTRRRSRRIRRRTARARGTFVVLHPTRAEVLIGGTFYAGEIKKSIFTVMNDRLPLEGVLPMHCSANIGDDGRRRDLLRALGHGQDDALRRSRALADRRRRARLGRQRHLQHRGRLLREGDPAVADGGAGDLQDDAHVRDDSRERRRGRARACSTSTTPRRPRTRAPPTSSSGSPNALPDEAGGPSELGHHADGRRVRDPAADRAADAGPGAVLLPLRLHREARRHGDRRHRAAADVLDLLRRAVPAAAARGLRADARREARRARGRPSGSSTPAGRAGRSARASGCRSRRRATLLHAALSGQLDGVEYRTDDVFGFEVPARVPGVDAKLLDPRSTWRDPGAYDRKARELAAMFRDELRDVRRRRAAAGRGRRSARLSRGTPPGASGAGVAAVRYRATKWMRSTTSSSSAPVAQGCARRSRRTTRARTWAMVSKLHPTRSHSGAAEGGINAALGNAGRRRARRTTPSTPSRARTTSATRTRSRSYAGRRPATSTSSSTGARSSRAATTGGSRSGRSAPRDRRAPSTPPTSPATSSSRCSTSRSAGARSPVYEEYFAWQLVDQRRPLPGRHLLGSAERRAQGARRQDRRCSRRAARGGSTARRRTRTRAPATGWRWRSVPASR